MSPDPLSYHMRASLVAIKVRGDRAIPEGGGWWRGADGVRLEYILPADGRTVPVTTGTIYALERRGYLARLNFRKHSWSDTYEVTSPEDAG